MQADVNFALLAGNAAAPARLYQKEGSDARALFTVAVTRKGRAGGKVGTDFVRCVAFGHTAEALARTLEKGDRVTVTGPIRVWHKVGEDGVPLERVEVLAATAEVHKRVAKPVSVQPCEGTPAPSQGPLGHPGEGGANDGPAAPEDVATAPSPSLTPLSDEDEEALLDALADSWSGD